MAKPADDLLTMFRLGKKSQQNFGMQISKKKETPGEGGSPYQPYKPSPLVRMHLHLQDRVEKAYR